MLLVTSPEANSGKTTLLNLIALLVPNGFPCVETSEATLFRSIERWRPTMIVDEADVILINNEPLRAVINAGWTRGTVVPRCIGDNHIPQAFSTFCPKIIGMKGRKLPDTTLTRCVIIELKRKLPGERTEHFRCVDDAGLSELRQQARRWSLDNGDNLKGGEPQMPDTFQNRLGDNHRLMFAIADLAGGDWPEQARMAAQRLANAVDTTSRNVRLLAAIREIIGERDAITSADLLAALTADDESEWKEWKTGKPLTLKQLSNVLTTFGIKPGRPVIDGRQQRGYIRASFEDAWKRYL
jgi:putative DNA primase/helicase